MNKPGPNVLLFLLVPFLLLACKPAPAPIDREPIKSLYFKGQEVSITDSIRILIIGNSITKHPPLPQSGWFSYWGMAASEAEKDFVHVLFKQINTHPKINGLGVLRYENLAVFERSFPDFDSTLLNDYFKEHTEYKPDLVIFRWGDNVDDTAATVNNFHNKFSELVAYFRYKGRKPPIFIITSTWYRSDKVNRELIKVCQEHNIPFVDLKGLRDTVGLTAETDNLPYDGGVASHPNDRGMQAIADRIFARFQSMVR